MTELHPFVQIAQHNIALLFANYLHSQGFICQLKQQDAGYWLYCRLDDRPQIKALFDEFVQNPMAEKYQQAAWQSGQQVEVEFDANTPSVKQQFLSHAGPVTLAVFVLCWLVFIASWLGFAHSVFAQLHFYPSLSIAAFLAEPWRLLTPALFHFGLLHIAFNTLWWWQLGGDVERHLSKGALLQLFLISAIVSNTGQFLMTGANFAGLSGVVYGLVGFCWVYGQLKPKQGISLANNLFVVLLIWMMLGIFNVLPINMANTAHFLGLVSGAALAWFKAKC